MNMFTTINSQGVNTKVRGTSAPSCTHQGHCLQGALHLLLAELEADEVVKHGPQLALEAGSVQVEHRLLRGHACLLSTVLWAARGRAALTLRGAAAQAGVSTKKGIPPLHSPFANNIMTIIHLSSY